MKTAQILEHKIHAQIFEKSINCFSGGAGDNNIINVNKHKNGDSMSMVKEQ